MFFYGFLVKKFLIEKLKNSLKTRLLHITNEEGPGPIRISQSPLSLVITLRRLCLCGHIARADPSQDHQRALTAAINRLRADWQRPRGRPRRAWLYVVRTTYRRTQYSTWTSNSKLPTTWHNQGLKSTRRGSGHRNAQNSVTCGDGYAY